jgi:hypothetical protein
VRYVSQGQQVRKAGLSCGVAALRDLSGFSTWGWGEVVRLRSYHMVSGEVQLVHVFLTSMLKVSSTPSLQAYSTFQHCDLSK